MESTAINTVYALILAYGANDYELERSIRLNKGYLTYIYVREDEANKVCEELNKHQTKNLKYFVVERILQ